MYSKKTMEKAVLECFRRLYKESTPSADFDKLVEEAEINEWGQKVIDYMAYEIDEDRATEIVNEVAKEFKIKSEWQKKSLNANVWLGCSPKFKLKDASNVEE